MALLCGACGGSDASESDSLALALADLEVLLPTASPTQQETLADGFVDEGERDRAASEWVECSAEIGVDAVIDFTDPTTITWTYTYDPDLDLDEMQAKQLEADKCRVDFFGLTESLYLGQNALSDDETEKINRNVADCLVAQGYDAEEWPAVDSDIDPSEEAICYDAAVADL